MFSRWRAWRERRRLRAMWRRAQRRAEERDRREHIWRHDRDLARSHDRLCRKYGCPDDPGWKGDGCAP